MKKRRLVIVAFLLCACLVIGIGYAGLSRVLVSETKVNMNENAANFPVQIIDYSATKNGEAYTFASNEASISASGTTIDITLPATALTASNDTLVLTLTIENQSIDYEAVLDAKATVQASVVNDAADYINVTVGDYSDTDGVLAVADSTANGGGDTTTVTITFKLDTPPLETVSAATITVKINATAQYPVA